MPKLLRKDRTNLTDLIQPKIRPENVRFLDEQCEKYEVSRSFYVDNVLTQIRKNRTKVRVVRPIGLTEKEKLARAARAKDIMRKREYRLKKKTAPKAA